MKVDENNLLTAISAHVVTFLNLHVIRKRLTRLDLPFIQFKHLAADLVDQIAANLIDLVSVKYLNMRNNSDLVVIGSDAGSRIWWTLRITAREHQQHSKKREKCVAHRNYGFGFRA